MCVVRIKVILNDFGVVNLAPLCLCGTPFHLKDALGVGLVSAGIHVFECSGFHKNLDDSHADNFFSVFGQSTGGVSPL